MKTYTFGRMDIYQKTFFFPFCCHTVTVGSSIMFKVKETVKECVYITKHYASLEEVDNKENIQMYLTRKALDG